MGRQASAAYSSLPAARRWGVEPRIGNADTYHRREPPWPSHPAGMI